MGSELGQSIRLKLANSTPVIGSWLSIGSTTVAEIMANAGFDFLVIDLEHSPISIETAAEMIHVIDLCDCSPIIRIAEYSPATIKQVLDAGAHGIIVPNVDSAKLATDIIRATRYPPSGSRGVGLHRAQGYGTTFNEYYDSVNEQIVVIAQIESQVAVNNIEQIVAVDGLDAVMIGPYDLSADLGVPGKFDSEIFTTSVAKVIKAANVSDIATGIHVVEPDPATIKLYLESGHRFLVYSVDMRILDVGARLGGSLLEGQQ